MVLFSHLVKSFGLIGTLIFIEACSTVGMPPVEQIHQVQKANKDLVQKVNKQIENIPQIAQFYCSKNKKVEVAYSKKAKKLNAKETVTVTFEGTSYQLSSVVNKDGKKYTNIRWTWHEMRNGKAFLYNNTKRTLAANCIKQ